MSLLNLINQIDTNNYDDKQHKEIESRKQALKKMGSFAKKMSLSALPLGAITAMTSTPAAAQAMDKPSGTAILDYAYTAEQLEETFYRKVLATEGIVPDMDRPIYEQIHKHEKAHVQFLKGVLGDNATEYDDADFDFTAGGTVHPFDSTNSGAYAQLTILSQAFEDTGVRAYKGQAANIDRSNPDGVTYLNAALRIHSVEARHAARIRKIRYRLTEGGLETVPWITGAGAKSPDLISPVYAGDPSEDNTTQAGVDVAADLGIDNPFANQAWDEPLTMDYVVNKILLPDEGFGFLNPQS